MLDSERPLYTVGTSAEILGVHPRTLRLYEDAGIIRPARKNNRRYYSAKDLEWISCVRYLIHEKGLNQEGLRRLLALIPCWEIISCPPGTKVHCAAWMGRSTPCWDKARRGGDEAKRCYACEVYLGARRYVLDQTEEQEAVSYSLAG